VKCVVEELEVAGTASPRVERVRNNDAVTELVSEAGGEVSGADLGEAVVADRAGQPVMTCSVRNFRHLVADAKALWRTAIGAAARRCVPLVNTWRSSGPQYVQAGR
jgi:hypothetical protein